MRVCVHVYMHICMLLTVQHFSHYAVALFFNVITKHTTFRCCMKMGDCCILDSAHTYRGCMTNRQFCFYFFSFFFNCMNKTKAKNKRNRTIQTKEDTSCWVGVAWCVYIPKQCVGGDVAINSSLLVLGRLRPERLWKISRLQRHQKMSVQHWGCTYLRTPQWR